MKGDNHVKKVGEHKKKGAYQTPAVNAKIKVSHLAGFRS